MGVTYIYIGAFYIEATASEPVYDQVQKIVRDLYDTGGWISDDGSTIEMDRNGQVRKDAAVVALKKILKTIKGGVFDGEVGICNMDDPSDYTLLTVKKNVLTVRKAKFEAPKKIAAKPKEKKTVKSAPKKAEKNRVKVEAPKKAVVKQKPKKASPSVINEEDRVFRNIEDIQGLDALKERENEFFMLFADKWFGGLPHGVEVPFKLDARHERLMNLRERVKMAGGKVEPEKNLPELARKAWDEVLQEMGSEMWDGDARLYKEAARRFFRDTKSSRPKSPKKAKAAKAPKKAAAPKKAIAKKDA